MPDIVDKPEEEIKPDASGKFPETVPWNKYVGIKESLGKKLDTATAKVASLEDQLKKTPNPEEHTQIKTELEALRASHQKVSEELKTIKDQTISEKRNSLIAKGVPAAQVKDLSEKELDTISGVLGVIPITKKPGADLGGGGGGVPPAGSKDRIKQGFETLHPSR